MTTAAAARRVGGTTKLGPCTTSTGPVHHSTGGRSTRIHSRRSGRAAAGRAVAVTPGGHAVRQPAASPPGQGEGAGVDVGPRPSRPRYLGQDVADAGGVGVEQGGGVDGDPHGARVGGVAGAGVPSVDAAVMDRTVADRRRRPGPPNRSRSPA